MQNISLNQECKTHLTEGGVANPKWIGIDCLLPHEQRQSP